MDAGVFFVVQVWRDACGFHAAARNVSREDVDEFDDPDALARFLAASAPAPASGEPGTEVPKESG
jgi:hypothetical protein